MGRCYSGTLKKEHLLHPVMRQLLASTLKKETGEKVNARIINTQFDIRLYGNIG